MKFYKKFLLSLLAGLIATFLVLLIRARYDYHGFSDAFFSSGVMFLSIAVVGIITNNGVFDIAIYGLNKFWFYFTTIGNRKSNLPKTYFDYKQSQWGKYKVTYLHNLLTSFTLIGFSLLFLFLSK